MAIVRKPKKKQVKKIPTTAEMEIVLAQWCTPRTNLVVPNVCWGFGIHECDLLVMTPHGYLTEVEIKISRADLIADKKKKHGHQSDIIKLLYFAIPEKLLKDIEHIPTHAGILVVSESSYGSYRDWKIRCERPAEVTTHRKIDDYEKYQIARLGALRVFGLKEKIIQLQNDNVYYRERNKLYDES